MRSIHASCMASKRFQRCTGNTNQINEISVKYGPLGNGNFLLYKYYRNWSCYNYWENITVPIVFINSIDDPIVPPQLVEKARAFVLNDNLKKNTKQSASGTKDRLLIEQKYGGHLGFHEGGFLNPNSLTWLDR